MTKYLLLLSSLLLTFLLPQTASADVAPGAWKRLPALQLVEDFGEFPRTGTLQFSFNPALPPTSKLTPGGNGIIGTALEGTVNIGKICSSSGSGGVFEFGGTEEGWVLPVVTPANDVNGVLTLDPINPSPANAVIVVFGATIMDGSSGRRDICSSGLVPWEGLFVFWLNQNGDQVLDPFRNLFRVGDLGTCGVAPDFTGTWGLNPFAGTATLGDCNFYAVFSDRQLNNAIGATTTAGIVSAEIEAIDSIPPGEMPDLKVLQMTAPPR